MKRSVILFTICSFCAISQLWADPIELSAERIDSKPLSGIPTKSPILVPGLDLTNGILTFTDGNYSNCTLTLLDDDGDVVYSTIVPAGTSTVTLPATLTGDYELRLYPGGTAYYFYGRIEL